jgi:hypothetical protein
MHFRLHPHVNRAASWLCAVAAAILTPAIAPAESPAPLERRTATFPTPASINLAGDGIVMEEDPFRERPVVEVRIRWDVTVAEGHDAADITANVLLPIDTDSGSPAVIDLDGPTLGWSGAGTFTHFEATDRYNGVFGDAGTWYSWEATGLPFDTVEVQPDSIIEVDYLVPEPGSAATILVVLAVATVPRRTTRRRRSSVASDQRTTEA